MNQTITKTPMIHNCMKIIIRWTTVEPQEVVSMSRVKNGLKCCWLSGERAWRLCYKSYAPFRSLKVPWPSASAYYNKFTSQSSSPKLQFTSADSSQLFPVMYWFAVCLLVLPNLFLSCLGAPTSHHQDTRTTLRARDKSTLEKTIVPTTVSLLFRLLHCDL